MKINNEKGHFSLHIAIISAAAHAGAWPVVQSVYVGIAGVLVAACAWHIPAWEDAKAKGGDAPAIYQAQEMWPQQVFDKLPGAHTRTAITYAVGNGGNLPGGVQKGG